MKKLIYTDKAPKPIGPYSQGVHYTEFNGLFFTSGQIALNGEGNIVSDDIREQTKTVCENLNHILAEHGSSLDNAIKTTVYMKDITEFPAMNEIYGRYFGVSLPARSTVEVARLPKDAKVMIDVIAHK
ncbi:MAG TPA: Rid family detoxifying hydrolase [Ignavibacteria bacterium]|nr:Rid family detoxifying hydrolase [Ignavibacteria bacterium]